MQTHDQLMYHVDVALALVRGEISRAYAKHPPQPPGWNGHCGYAVILEEVDELWEHVKKDTSTTAAAGKEAIQISAMGVRYYVECVAGALRHDTRRPDQSNGEAPPHGTASL